MERGSRNQPAERLHLIIIGRPAAPVSDGPPRRGPRRSWPTAAPCGGRRGSATVLVLLLGARARSAAPKAGTLLSAGHRIPGPLRRSSKHSTPSREVSKGVSKLRLSALPRTPSMRSSKKVVGVRLGSAGRERGLEPIAQQFQPHPDYRPPRPSTSTWRPYLGPHQRDGLRPVGVLQAGPLPLAPFRGHNLRSA
jgi:hypothetical protein